MTRKFAWWGAFGLAATALTASGALAEAVRLTAVEDDLGWSDFDGKVRSSQVYTTTDDPPPPPPKIKPRQGIGAGADAIGSPSDVPPPKNPAPLEGPVQGYGPSQKNGYGPVQSGPIQNGAVKNGAVQNGAVQNGGLKYSPVQDGAIQNGAVQNGAVQKDSYSPIQNDYVGPQQKGGYYGESCGHDFAPGCGYDSGPSCGYAAPSCGYDSAPSCGYDNSCYGDCFAPSSCCCTRWAFRAEALIWDRSDAPNQVIATNGGGASINAADYNFDAAGGPRLSLFYRGFMDTCWDFEATYFGIHGWESTQTLAGTTVIATTPVINIGGGAALTSTYHSRLDSSEFNLRRQVSNWATFLVGFRWIEQAEILDNDFGPANLNTNVNNHLYGIQMGFDTLLWNRGGPWLVEGIGKVGIYGVNSDVTTTTTGVGGALPLITAADNDTAFTADLGVTAVYRMTSYADLRVGYNLFWIDGIAEAPSQYATTNIATGVATVEQNNTQFYHGASIGIEIRH